ncbi:MAG: hypothetical protein HND53_01745 [Proteobacteria bacterium]|nr:hypothetical protein [Pseudomonadota bacterium]NOG59193.1 hypothetical protein [Pseudomonadota bacterium]
MAETNKLHQINMQYSSKEDRILLRTSTENNDEYLIWLTRRYTKLLIDVFDKEIDKRGGTTTLSSQKQTKKFFEEGAFEKPYVEETPKNHPLGENGVLAFGIKTGTDEQGNFVLIIQSESGKGITYNLNDSLLYMFYSLLMQSVDRAEWQLGKHGESASSSQLH